MALAGSYLDLDELAARTVAPEGLVYGDFFDPTGEWDDPDKVAKRESWQTFAKSSLVIETSKINARLRKRYAVPFGDPCPEIVRGWLAAAVTPLLYKRRGWDPSDAQSEDILASAQAALDEMKEAADANEGLYDLPLRQDDAASAISKGGPFGYSESDPYTWTDVQAEAVRR